MLIDLFKDPTLLSRSSKELGGLKTRKCDVLEDLSYYNEEIAVSSDSQYHIDSVCNALDKTRNYIEYFGKISDSHNEIEKLGVCKYGRKYTTIISMEDSLDYVLHRLSGASIDNIRMIPNYYELSRSILKTNYAALETMDFDTLLDVDPKLDKYLTDLMSKTEDEEPYGFVTKNFFLKLMREVLQEVGLVLEYTTFQYMSMIPKGTAVLRSKSFCSFVLSSDVKLEDNLVLKSEGHSDYTLIVRSFEKKTYPNFIELRYAE